MKQLHSLTRVISIALVSALASTVAAQVGEEMSAPVVTPPPAQPPFRGVIAPTVDEAQPAWNFLPRAPAGAPNILAVMLDDIGFAQLGCYGAPIDTPNIDRLARGGLRYNNFHATPLCSPSRAAFLTGRNHHSCALGIISEFSTGFPGYNGRMPLSHSMLSEVLGPAGWSTFALGKWHLTPPEDANLAATRRWWPLGRGFDRYYGFLGGTTSRWVPWLTHDNHFVRPPKTPDDGYHLLTDMTEKAIEYILDVKHVAPDRPFFMYFAPGGCRAPQQVPAEWIEEYRGRFDGGWDEYREKTLARQIGMGICPPGTRLSPRDPLIKPWRELSVREQALFARQMEVYAAYVSFVDDHVGRLVALLEELGQLDNTLIIVTSDNGASIEGGVDGLPNEVLFFNNVPVSFEQVDASKDDWGGPKTFPAFAAGWAFAGNTPFQRWKRDATRGGTAEPFVVHWPAGFGARGEIRTQFTHAVDVVPTVLDVLDVAMPASINGVGQAPLEGVSFASTFDDPDTELTREAQYFEMVGRRAIYHDGWRAYSPWEFGQEITAESLENDTEWMLFHIDDDFSESRNVADRHPDKVEELERLWWVQASRYNALPLDGRSTLRAMERRPRMTDPRSRYVYYPGAGEIGSSVAANVLNRSFTITAEVDIPPDGAEGVLLAQGGTFAGYSLFVKDARLYYAHNYVNLQEFTLKSSQELAAGEHTLRFEFERTGPPTFAEGRGAPGVGRLFIDGRQVGEMDIPVTVPISFALSGEGLCCGWDSLSPAVSAYADEFPFTGTIRRVTVDLEPAVAAPPPDTRPID
jgi:arylsulfatase